MHVSRERWIRWNGCDIASNNNNNNEEEDDDDERGRLLPRHEVLEWACEGEVREERVADGKSLEYSETQSSAGGCSHCCVL